MMGWVMNETRRSRKIQQTAMPQAIATIAWKILVLSSSKCSRKLMEGMRSSSASTGSMVLVTSGIGGILGGRIYFGRSRIGLRVFWQPGVARGGYRPSGRLWRQNRLLLFPFLLALLIFQLADFRFDLSLELVGGALELVQRLANLARDAWQLLGSKKKQSQHKEDDSIRETHLAHNSGAAELTATQAGCRETYVERSSPDWLLALDIGRRHPNCTHRAISPSICAPFLGTSACHESYPRALPFRACQNTLLKTGGGFDASLHG